MGGLGVHNRLDERQPKLFVLHGGARVCVQNREVWAASGPFSLAAPGHASNISYKERKALLKLLEHTGRAVACVSACKQSEPL
tara:strand:- start:2384 stop:2632 length:249 start_codon:yes stop_codon:yes gene_type:complete